jgi:hypothetical protein
VVYPAKARFQRLSIVRRLFLLGFRFAATQPTALVFLRALRVSVLSVLKEVASSTPSGLAEKSVFRKSAMSFRIFND